MSTAFLWQNALANAWVGDRGTAALPALSLANLSDPQPRVRTRWPGGAGVSVWFDMGASAEIACVALISTTLGSAGGTTLVRARLSDDPLFATAAWDTGVLDPATDAYANGNVVLVHPTSASGRFLLVEMEDAAAGLIDVGRIVAGPLWRCTHSWSLGRQQGRMILDRRDRNPYTGVEFPVRAVANPRQASFTLGTVRLAEETEWRGMLNSISAAGDVLWIPDDGLSLAELNQQCIWGAPVQPGESALLQRAGFLHHTRSFTLTERV